MEDSARRVAAEPSVGDEDSEQIGLTTNGVGSSEDGDKDAAKDIADGGDEFSENRNGLNDLQTNCQRINEDGARSDQPKHSKSASATLVEEKNFASLAAGMSPELYRSIRSIIPSSDPLDDPDFSPIDYINSLFPNEQSLVDLDTVIAKMRLRTRRIDYEVATQLRQLARTGDKGQRDLVEARQSVSSLSHKIGDIKKKAEASEVMVQEICADIKSLDHAKKHLTNTITALKRVHMLVTGVEQLREFTNKKQFREVANLLEAVNQLSQSFQEYKDIPRLRLLTEQVIYLKESLVKIVYEEFKAAERQPNSTAPSHLADVCFVVDALGKEEKKAFVKWFCGQRLQSYIATFNPADDSSRLEHCNRRYMWMRSELVKLDTQYPEIFPPAWGMAACVCEEFCTITRARLSGLLDQSRNPPVKPLLQALKDTQQFETDMVKKFATLPLPIDIETGAGLSPFGDVAESAGKGKDVGGDTDEEGDGEMDEDESEGEYSKEAMKSRLEKFRQKKRLEREKAEKAKNPLSLGLERSRKRFRGIISSVFDPYMRYYVQEEDNLMEIQYNTLLGEEQWKINAGEPLKLLESCKGLVLNFNKVMKRFASRNRSHGFFELYRVFQKYWRRYKQALEEKLRDMEEEEKADRNDETICLIINTAEYSQTMCKEMVSIITSTIDKSFVPDVTLEKEEEEFNRLVVKGLKTLSSLLHGEIEKALVQLTQRPWASWQTVNDQSDYVSQITSTIHSRVPLFNEYLSVMHFRFFCDSFVGQLIPTLLSSIFKCRTISEVGAEQLLLDMTSIKSILMTMPSLTSGSEAAPSAPPRYKKLINKEMGKVEVFLKVLMAKPEALANTYLALVSDSTEGHFQKLMELKGIPKQDQHMLLEQYRLKKALR